MELLTIVCDRNPNLDEAMSVLQLDAKWGCVKDVRPAAAMGDALECQVAPHCRQHVVWQLNAAGFRIVEGGQL